MEKAADTRATLRFADVREILAASFGVHESKRKTFEARLQQLQKLGLPRGTNVGRAGRAQYAYWQLAEIALYLDLLDAGLSPAMIEAHFATSPPYYAAAGTGRAFDARPAGAEDIFLVLHLNALNALRSATPGRQAPSFADHLQKNQLASKTLKEATTGDAGLGGEGPAVLVNLTRRLRSLRSAVEQLLPDQASSLTFPR